MKESDRLYTGFREFISKDQYKEYDKEYFSRKRPSKQFMVSFINRYVDVKKLSKKVNIDKKQKIKPYLNYNSPINQKISNEERLAAYQKRKRVYKHKGTLKLNKIIKFENKKYLLLHKIKNSDLKIIKMKRPDL